jgi:hypothetical protein
VEPGHGGQEISVDSNSRPEDLAVEVRELKKKLIDLEHRFEEFVKQFE